MKNTMKTQKILTRRSLLAGLTSLALLTGATWAPCLAISTSEDKVLSRWKQTAGTSTMGIALLKYLKECDSSLATNSLNGKASYRRGYLYGILGCTRTAIEDLTHAIALSPYDSKAYAERGLCYSDLAQYPQALADLNQAIKLDPRYGNAVFARARVYLALGRPLLAERDLRYCLNSAVKFSAELPGEYDPNHYNAVSYYLGTIYDKQGKTDYAESYYKDSLKSPEPSIAGYLHRYAEQPSDGQSRLAKLENSSKALSERSFKTLEGPSGGLKIGKNN